MIVLYVFLTYKHIFIKNQKNYKFIFKRNHHTRGEIDVICDINKKECIKFISLSSSQNIEKIENSLKIFQDQ